MPIPSYFKSSSLALFLFAIPWTSFALFWMAGSWYQSESIPFTLFGVPFVLIGIGMLLAPLWTYKKALKTVYVISDQRALTFDGGWSTTSIRSYQPHQLDTIYRKEKKDGSGDIILSVRSWCDSDNDKQQEELGFMRIENVKKVETILKELHTSMPTHANSAK